MNNLVLNKLPSFLWTVILAEVTSRAAQNSRTWRRQEETQQPLFCPAMQIRHLYFSNAQKQHLGHLSAENSAHNWQKHSHPLPLPSNFSNAARFAKDLPLSQRGKQSFYFLQHLFKRWIYSNHWTQIIWGPPRAWRGIRYSVYMEDPKAPKTRWGHLPFPALQVISKLLVGKET